MVDIPLILPQWKLFIEKLKKNGIWLLELGEAQEMLLQSWLPFSAGTNSYIQAFSPLQAPNYLPGPYLIPTGEQMGVERRKIIWARML